ncbi:MAG: hypothetical protein WD689_07265 [Gaiellaceae bacterium]
MRARWAATVELMSKKEAQMSTSVALAPPVYEAPALTWVGETAQAVATPIWAVLVGFSFALALAYASYCTYVGGSPDISFGWRGFRVTCNR